MKYDLGGRKVLKTVKSPDDQTFFDHVFVSPDGKWLVAGQRRIKPYSVTLVIFSADTLEEAARIPGPKDQAVGTFFDTVLFTPDSRRLITRCKGPVLVWDLANKAIARSVPVGELEYARLAMSPDGARVVLAGMPKYDERRAGRSHDPRDLPQPRLLLIDLTDSKREPEVLILPEGMVTGLAFHPSGGTLALGAYGGTHLIDLSARSK